jgi:hypothetical protein
MARRTCCDLGSIRLPIPDTTLVQLAQRMDWQSLERPFGTRATQTGPAGCYEHSAQLGRVIRDVGRKIGEDARLRTIFAWPLSLARPFLPSSNKSAYR